MRLLTVSARIGYPKLAEFGQNVNKNSVFFLNKIMSFYELKFLMEGLRALAVGSNKGLDVYMCF